MDCGAGIYCIGSVHLEHAKTEYSSLFHYAIAPFSAAESSHLPTWHRACFISEQFCLGIPSHVEITSGSSLSQAQEIWHVHYPLHNTFCKFYVSLIQKCQKKERTRALNTQPDSYGHFDFVPTLHLVPVGSCT